MRPRGARSKIALAVAAALAGAIAPRGPALADVAAAGAAEGPGGGLQEVVVTARKVSENLQIVPVSIDVFTQRDLQNLGIATMDDYLQRLPAISYNSTGPGTQVFVCRWVSYVIIPNFANTESSTGFFVVVMSMRFEGAVDDMIL